MEKKLGISIFNTFDLFVGTSTGSIIAAFVVLNKELAVLVSEYKNNAPEIFKKNWSFGGLLRSKYDGNSLEAFLYKHFDSKVLGDIDKPLIINATNVSTGSVHIFKSPFQEEYWRDQDVLLYKAILASCAAPAFFNPVKISNDLICDGGIWANNPAFVGYVDAVSKFNISPSKIKIFSIGTGHANQFYLDAKFWGILTGWKKTKIIDFVMSNQTQYVNNSMKLILNENIFRIDPQIDNWRLDNYEIIPTLISLAQKEISQNGNSIKKFLK